MVPCSGFASESYDLFALGVLEERDAVQIQEHLRQGCATCRRETSSGLERASGYAVLAPVREPPASLRNRVIGLVQPSAPRETSSGWLMAWRTWAVVSSLALGVALVVLFVRPIPLDSGRTVLTRLSPPPVPAITEPAKESPQRESSPAVPAIQPHAPAPIFSGEAELARQREQIAQLQLDLQNRSQELAAAQQTELSLQAALRARPAQPDQSTALAAAQARIDELSRQLARQTALYRAALEQPRAQDAQNGEITALLRAPDLRVVTLRSTERGQQATGRALVTESGQGIFSASHLPALPSGRTYQLWIMRERGPAIVSGGIFQPDQFSSAIFRMDHANFLSGITALAVTEEPAGGSSLPTGHKILVGLAKA